MTVSLVYQVQTSNGGSGTTIGLIVVGLQLVIDPGSMAYPVRTDEIAHSDWHTNMVSVGHRKPLALRPFRFATRRLRSISVGGLRRLQYTSLLLTRSYWGLMYAFNWWDIIDEHVVLGGALMFDDLDRLQGLGVDAVLNLCAERSDDRHQLRAAGIAYLWLPVMDVFPPTFDQIVQGIGWIEQQLQVNRTIYIHCAVGVGRSATLLACWLLYAKRMNVPQALRFLKARRPQVGLTRLQVRRLEEFEGWLAGSGGEIERLTTQRGEG